MPQTEQPMMSGSLTRADRGKVKRFNEDLSGIHNFAVQRPEEGERDRERSHIKQSYAKARSRGNIVINNFYSYSNAEHPPSDALMPQRHFEDQNVTCVSSSML